MEIQNNNKAEGVKPTLPKAAKIMENIETASRVAPMSEEGMAEIKKRGEEFVEWMKSLKPSEIQESEWGNYQDQLADKWKEYHEYCLQYNYNFLTFKEERDWIVKELTEGEYTHETVFMAEQLWAEWLFYLKNLKITNGDCVNIGIDVRNSVRLHSLLTKMTSVKGIDSKEFAMYAALLRKIGGVSKAYANIEKDMKEIGEAAMDCRQGFDIDSKLLLEQLSEAEEAHAAVAQEEVTPVSDVV